MALPPLELVSLQGKAALLPGVFSVYVGKFGGSAGGDSGLVKDAGQDRAAHHRLEPACFTSYLSNDTINKQAIPLQHPGRPT